MHARRGGQVCEGHNAAAARRDFSKASGAGLGIPAVSIRPPGKIALPSKKPCRKARKTRLPLFKGPSGYYAVSVLNLVLAAKALGSRLGSKSVRGRACLRDQSPAPDRIPFSPYFFHRFQHQKRIDLPRHFVGASGGESLRKSGSPPKSLTMLKKKLIGEFPFGIRKPRRCCGQLHHNEYWKRPADHFVVFREKSRRLRWATSMRPQKYLILPHSRTFVVGDSSAIFTTDTAAGFF